MSDKKLISRIAKKKYYLRVILFIKPLLLLKWFCKTAIESESNLFMVLHILVEYTHILNVKKIL